jgi:hypothetical protein
MSTLSVDIAGARLLGICVEVAEWLQLPHVPATIAAANVNNATTHVDILNLLDYFFFVQPPSLP